MTKRLNRTINYSKNRTLRVLLYWDPQQPMSISLKRERTYRPSKFWQPIRRNATIKLLRWCLKMEWLVSLTNHTKQH